MTTYYDPMILICLADTGWCSWEDLGVWTWFEFSWVYWRWFVATMMLKESLRAEDDPCKALIAWESPKVTGSGTYRFILPRDVHVILLFKSFICGILIYPPLKGSTIATRQTPGWIISEFKQPISWEIKLHLSLDNGMCLVCSMATSYGWICHEILHCFCQI